MELSRGMAWTAAVVVGVGAFFLGRTTAMNKSNSSGANAPAASAPAEAGTPAAGTAASAGAGNANAGAPVAVPAVAVPDPNRNTDGDCMTDAEEVAAGTDPNHADGDRDGVSDCDEIACGSNPADAQEKCYACGWKRNDPGNLISDGAAIGNVVKNITLADQCGDQVSIWDFYGQYVILYMTAAW